MVKAKETYSGELQSGNSIIHHDCKITISVTKRAFLGPKNKVHQRSCKKVIECIPSISPGRYVLKNDAVSVEFSWRQGSCMHGMIFRFRKNLS